MKKLDYNQKEEMLDALYNKDTDIFEKILKKTKGELRADAICQAINEGMEDVVESYLPVKMMFGRKRLNGGILKACAEKGLIEMARKLINHSDQRGIQDSILKSIRSSNFEMVKLITNNCNQDFMGYATVYAARHGEGEIAKYLLEKTNPDIVNHRALEEGVEFGNVDSVKTILGFYRDFFKSKGDEYERMIDKCLEKSAYHNNKKDIFDILIKENPSQKGCESALLSAIYNNNKHIIKVLTNKLSIESLDNVSEISNNKNTDFQMYVRTKTFHNNKGYWDGNFYFMKLKNIKLDRIALNENISSDNLKVKQKKF